MGDRGLGSWQGAGATSAARVDALVAASGVRARPGKDSRHWGYQRVDAGQGDTGARCRAAAASRHARYGCASTLAFELSHGEGQRIIVNCGGGELAGGQVPVRIEQGLRGTAAHSTLVLDDANSTAVLIKGQIGKGVEEVDIARTTVKQKGAMRAAGSRRTMAMPRASACIHRRTLCCATTAAACRARTCSNPRASKGKRGKIGFRHPLPPRLGIEAGLSDDRRGAGLALPDGSYWQFRLAGDSGEAQIAIEDSLWVDGQGRPRATKQLVVAGHDIAQRGTLLLAAQTHGVKLRG